MHVHFSYDPDKALLLRKVLNALVKLALNNGIPHGFVVGHSKKQMENSTFRDGLGADLLKVLLGKNSAAITGTTLYLVTDEISPPVSDPMPILLPFLPVSWVDKIGKMTCAKTIIFVPWSESDLKDYLIAYPGSREITEL